MSHTYKYGVCAQEIIPHNECEFNMRENKAKQHVENKRNMQVDKEYAAACKEESIMQLKTKENIMYKQTLFTPSAKS